MCQQKLCQLLDIVLPDSYKSPYGFEMTYNFKPSLLFRPVKGPMLLDSPFFLMAVWLEGQIAVEVESINELQF